LFNDSDRLLEKNWSYYPTNQIIGGSQKVRFITCCIDYWVDVYISSGHEILCFPSRLIICVRIWQDVRLKFFLEHQHKVFRHDLHSVYCFLIFWSIFLHLFNCSRFDCALILCIFFTVFYFFLFFICLKAIRESPINAQTR
jgi:hypothetical protein